MRESDRGKALIVMEPPFLLEPIIIGSDIEPARRQLEIGGNDRLDTIDAGVDDGRRFDGVMDAFDADPTARITRQGKTVDAEIEELLQSRRIEDRHHGIEEGEFALMRDRR